MKKETRVSTSHIVLPFHTTTRLEESLKAPAELLFPSQRSISLPLLHFKLSQRVRQDRPHQNCQHSLLNWICLKKVLQKYGGIFKLPSLYTKVRVGPLLFLSVPSYTTGTHKIISHIQHSIHFFLFFLNHAC